MSHYKPYIDPSRQISKAARMRNRCIALGVFLLICFGIGSCISSKEKPRQTKEGISREDAVPIPEDTLVTKQIEAMESEGGENDTLGNTTSIDLDNPAALPQPAVKSGNHVKSQKNVFLAEKIDNLLQAYKPEHAMILVVDAKSNEIIAWGERKNNANQSQPDYLIRNTFPAASLAKTITTAAALESGRYSLHTPIPMIGRTHRLYRDQLKVPKNYRGPTLPLQDAYAQSANPPMGIIGQTLGANRLKSAARNLGYNMNFIGGLPKRASYTPPDTGFGLAEAACGFTDATTISPLLAAAQVRAILLKKPLEIPWAENLDGFAPKKRFALEVNKFSDNTYFGLRQAMIRSITHGTGSKNISTRNMARKNYDALTIGGKTGSLDGKDPYGRYDWFMGFAQSKEKPDKAIIVVVMQAFDPQGMRPQPTTQVAAMVINYWAHQALWGNQKK